MKKRLPYGFLLLISFAFCINGTAQGLYQVSLDEKVQNSSFIFEGRVIEKQSFWNSQHTTIFTSNKVEIYKIFKGSAQNDFVEIVTEGGEVENFSVHATEVATLKPDETGVFFCITNPLALRSPATSNVLLYIYASSQGFLKYNPITLSANAPFTRIANIESDLYNALEQKTGKAFRDIKAFNVSSLKKSNPNYRTLAVNITSFSPTTVNAGATLDPTTNVLTITGTGFGSASGSAAVIFDDPVDGTGGSTTSVPYNDPLIISWSATSIQLRVPSDAGTGTITVSDNLGVTGSSATPLTVNYSVMTGTFSFSGTTVTKEINLMSTNGSGGYNIHYCTNSAGGGVDLNLATPQKQAFQRAYTTWKELTGFNIVESTTTNNQVVADDNNNTIMFDNNNTGQLPLASGVLGVCYTYASMCTPLLTRQVQRTGFDIVIRNAGVSLGSANFTNGPCPPASSSFTNLDLETVLLHELGHAIGLNHVNDDLQGSFLPNINPGKLMNFSLVNGVRRSTPDQSAYNGAIYLTTAQGNVYGSCGLFTTEMTQLARTTESKDECPTFPTTALPNNTVVAFDLVHATSNSLTDPQYTALRCTGTGTGVTNTAFYAFKTASNGSLILTVSGYGTTPAALAACTPTGSYPAAAGVELALYAVSSCPIGQSFPAPTACRTFNADGTLSSVSGLSANTTYLLVADGIENTKASFSLNFGGTVLPIKFQSFTGEVMTDANRLKWIVDYAINVKKLVLEKSDDGTSFTAIMEVDGNDISSSAQYDDARPFIGKNYYRLVVENLDGSRGYSNVVLLTRKEKFFVSIFPNPAKTVVNVEIKTTEAGNYSFDLYNNTGQVVVHQNHAVTLSRQMLVVPAGNLAKGSYFLKITNSRNELIKNIPVVIN